MVKSVCDVSTVSEGGDTIFIPHPAKKIEVIINKERVCLQRVLFIFCMEASLVYWSMRINRSPLGVIVFLDVCSALGGGAFDDVLSCGRTVPFSPVFRFKRLREERVT